MTQLEKIARHVLFSDPSPFGVTPETEPQIREIAWSAHGEKAIAYVRGALLKMRDPDPAIISAGKIKADELCDGVSSSIRISVGMTAEIWTAMIDAILNEQP